MKRAATKILPSVEYLRECFVYEQSTGVLRWKRRPLGHFSTERSWGEWNKRFTGKIVGRGTKRGYCLTILFGERWLLHRIIWKLMTGMEPPETIDHVDGDPANNRWANLRVATQLEQMWNSRFRRNNTSGYRGVVASRGKWQVQIRAGGIRRFLGRFDTLEEATVVYEAAAREAHGGFYRSPL